LVEEDILHSVTPQYAFRVMEWNWISPTECRMITDRGRKLLQLHESSAVAQTRGQLLDALSHQRFRRVPRFIRTQFGDSIVNTRVCACTVADDWARRQVSSSPDDLKDAAFNLGSMHRAMAPLAGTFSLQKKRPLSELLRDDLDALHTTEYLCEQESETPFAQVFVLYRDVIFSRAERAWETLRQSGLEDRERQAEEQGSLSFGQYVPTKLARTEEGNIATIDFSEVSLSDPEADVYSFCKYVHSSGNTMLLPQVLKIYNDRVGNDRERTNRVIGFIGFPHELAAAARTYLASDWRSDPSLAELLEMSLGVRHVGGAHRD
jgi:hypothetical protein